MRGDFTRSTFRPEKHYTSVRLQQGRVQLDADWNEQMDIQRYQQQAAQAAFIGRAGAPKSGGGFAITAADGPDLAISPGRYYVDGLLCELESDAAGKGTTYQTQPDLPGAPKLSSLAAGVYIAYLDVFTRHVTALEDERLREVALAGPDTTTRTQTTWQVKLLKIPAAIGVLDAIDLRTYLPAPDLKLAARTRVLDGSATGDAAIGSGYDRLDNHLYRVEIHSGGKVGTDAIQLKWSRDNGSLVTPWIDQRDAQLIVGPTGHDEQRGFGVGAWVEITDDERELRREPGVLCRITSIEGPAITVDKTVSRADFKRGPKVRLWDGVQALPATIGTGVWLPLEAGLEIALVGTTCHTGDYWMIPARTATRDVEWPQVAGAPAFVSRHGDVHSFTDLAQVEWSGTAITKILDRRYIFPSLADLRNVDPQHFEQMIYTHRHQGDADGTAIPRGGIQNAAIDGTKIDTAAQVQVTKLGINTAIGSDPLSVGGNIKQTGTDLLIDNLDRRGGAIGTLRRALVHDTSDMLTLNYAGDYSGGVKVHGARMDLLANTSPLHIANAWNNTWSSETNSATIANDTSGFKALMLVGNRAGVANAVRRVGVWDNLDVNGALLVSSHYKQTGTDFQIDNSTARTTATGTATGTTRRALVHESGDVLTLNYGNDYTGNVRVGSHLTISGNDLRIDSSSRRGGRGGDYRRAVVHSGNDTLRINYDNDYSSGVQIDGQLNINSRATLSNNTLYLRSLTDGHHALGHFGHSDRYFAGLTSLDGPALYGWSGGALGTAKLPHSAIEGAAILAGSGYVALPEMEDDFSGGFTIEAWVYFDYKTGTTMPNYERIIDFSNTLNSTPCDNILFGNAGTSRSLIFEVKNASNKSVFLVKATDAIETGKWLHLCVTITASGTLTLYKNGSALSYTTTGTIALPEKKKRANNYIGKSPYSGDELFYGRIANVRLWKRALTADQVGDHFDNTRNMDTSDLLGWWRLTDGSSRDYSGKGRTGTFSGGNTTNYLTSYQRAALTWDSSDNVSVTEALTVGGTLGVTGNATVGSLVVSGRMKTGNTKQIAATSNSTAVSSTTSWADMDDLSATVTVTSGTLLILVNIGACQSQLSGVRGLFRILVDGTSVATTAHEFPSGGFQLRDVSMHWLATNLSSGSHTIKVQWKTDAGGSEVKCGWYSATRALTVIEL